MIEGPTKVTQLSANADVLAIGDRLVPGSGTSATNNDAGRIAKQAQATISDATTTAAAFNNIQNCIGFAAQADNSNEDAQIKAPSTALTSDGRCESKTRAKATYLKPSSPVHGSEITTVPSRRASGSMKASPCARGS